MSKKSKPFAHAFLTIRDRSTKSGVKSEKPAKIFIDSGASVTVLPEKFAKSMESKMGSFDGESINIQTVNGLKPVRRLKNAEVCLGHVCAAADVIVTDGSFGDIAIGSDFLVKADCKIDFKKKTMECGGRKIKFTMEA